MYSGVQVGFFSPILPVKGRGFERASWIWQFKLQDWCHSHRFISLDHGIHAEKPGVLFYQEACVE